MTLLIEFRNKEGKEIGKCDARCYNAKGSRCRCLCGGVNHGVGRKKAVFNCVNNPNSILEKNKEIKVIFYPNQYKFFI